MHPPASQPTPRSLHRALRPVAAAILLAAAATLGLLAGGGTEAESRAKLPARPNVIVLLTDDQEAGSMRVMKTVNKLMKRRGVTLKRFYANYPLCCPSRATLFTGQYSHNHGVLSNLPPDGGYGVFNELHGRDYLPIWLQQAGYQTSYIGKYLNGYAEADEYGTTPTEVPAGWNDWHVLAPSRAQYFNYTLNQNGSLRQYTEAEEDYSTDIFTNKARRFIRRNAQAETPFYLQLGYAAPHGGGGGSPGRSCNRAAQPAPRHLGELRQRQKGELPPSFNEVDVSDKPSPIANRDPLTPGQVTDTLRKRRCAWESLLAVDESVGELLQELERDRIRRETYVFYLSDNGYLRGEHRVRDKKSFLYESSARVPFVAVGPGFARGESSEDLTVNADLATTILDLTGAPASKTQDGQSLLPTLFNPATEHGRAILLEDYADGTTVGLRTSRYLYTEWTTQRPQVERELYDTVVDPYELNNLAGDPAYAELIDELAAQLDELRACAGETCRQQPTGTLSFVTGGGRNCARPPVTARFESPSPGLQSVEFLAGKLQFALDIEPPYEAAVPEGTLRRALPEPVEVVARANFRDGRRLAVPAQLQGCEA